MRNWLRTGVLTLIWAGLLGVILLNAASAGTVNGEVIDQDGKPVAGATVRLFRWDGDRRQNFPCSPLLRTDANVTFRADDVPDGSITAHLLPSETQPLCSHFFRVEDGAAPAVRIIAGEPRVEQFLVRAPSGQPLKGAVVREIEVTDQNGPVWFMPTTLQEILKQSPQSDANGIITLPPMSRGARVSVRVSHPGFAPGAWKGTIGDSAGPHELVLEAGTSVEFLFVENGQPADIDQFSLRLFAEESTETRHYDESEIGLSASSGRKGLCLAVRDYSLLWLRKPDVVITPWVSPNLNTSERLRFDNQSGTQFTFHVFRKRPIRVRVVDAETREALSDADVGTEMPNHGAEQFGGVTPKKWHFVAWGERTADDAGVLQVDAVNGPVRLKASLEGYQDSVAEVVVKADDQLPEFEIRLQRLRPIRGIVTDESGQPVSGAIVHCFNWGSRLVETDADGRFEVNLATLPPAGEGDTQKAIVAFHPNLPLHAVSPINLRAEHGNQNVVLAMHQAAPDELLKDLAPWFRYEGTGKPDPAAIPVPLREISASPPEITDGEWLNNPRNLSSLGDCRGRPVLLHFWFVGCGSCHARFPVLQLIHRLYGDRITVIGVHTNGNSLDEVARHLPTTGLQHPMVIDRPEGLITQRWKPLVTSYPSYVLIDSDGMIRHASKLPGLPLSLLLIEVVRTAVLKD